MKNNPWSWCIFDELIVEWLANMFSLTSSVRGKLFEILREDKLADTLGIILVTSTAGGWVGVPSPHSFLLFSFAS